MATVKIKTKKPDQDWEELSSFDSNDVIGSFQELITKYQASSQDIELLVIADSVGGFLVCGAALCWGKEFHDKSPIALGGVAQEKADGLWQGATANAGLSGLFQDIFYSKQD